MCFNTFFSTLVSTIFLENNVKTIEFCQFFEIIIFVYQLHRILRSDNLHRTYGTVLRSSANEPNEIGPKLSCKKVKILTSTHWLVDVWFWSMYAVRVAE